MSFNKILKLADAVAKKVESDIYEAFDVINPNDFNQEVANMQKELVQLASVIKSTELEQYKKFAFKLLMPGFGIDGKYGPLTKAALGVANLIAKESGIPEMDFSLSKESISDNIKNIKNLRRKLTKDFTKSVGEMAYNITGKPPSKITEPSWLVSKDLENKIKMNEIPNRVQSLLDIGSTAKKS